MSRSVIRSTSVTGSMTLVSRVLGLVRDVVFARFIGAGPLMDAFVVAFRIPNMLRRFFAEGAFNQAFVPVLGEWKTRRERVEVRELLDGVAGTLGGFLLLLTVAGVIAAPLLIYAVASGFATEPDQFDRATAMVRLTFPYVLFISLTAFAGGILNTWGRFAVPAFTPVILNLCLIGAAIWVASGVDRPELVLAGGVFVAGVLQLAFQLPFLARLRLLPVPRPGRARTGVRRILGLMGPALFGSSVQQINLLVNTNVATFLGAGSVSWLYYADRLMEFPLGVFAIALGTVILPRLSKLHADNSVAAFSATVDSALRLVALVAVPAGVGLFLLAEPLLATIFQGGDFDVVDTRMAGVALRVFAFGMVGFSLVKVLAPGFFSRQDTRTPVRAAAAGVAVNVAGVAVIVPLMVRFDWDAPHAGLAAALSLSAFVNAGFLFVVLIRRGVYRPAPGWGVFTARVLAANAVMAAVILYLSPAAPVWMVMNPWSRVVALGTLVIGGAGMYFLTALTLGLKPAHFKNP